MAAEHRHDPNTHVERKYDSHQVNGPCAPQRFGTKPKIFSQTYDSNRLAQASLILNEGIMRE
jgi:hypothetical protein